MSVQCEIKLLEIGSELRHKSIRYFSIQPVRNHYLTHDPLDKWLLAEFGFNVNYSKSTPGRYVGNITIQSFSILSLGSNAGIV